MEIVPRSYAHIMEMMTPTRWKYKNTKRNKSYSEWKDLCINTIDKVNDVRERIVNTDGIAGERKNVWLPSIVDKELKDYEYSAGDTYIRPLGLKNSKITGIKYHDPDIVRDNKNESPETMKYYKCCISFTFNVVYTIKNHPLFILLECCIRMSVSLSAYR